MKVKAAAKIKREQRDAQVKIILRPLSLKRRGVRAAVRMRQGCCFA